jgi:hypothetical protein
MVERAQVLIGEISSLHSRRLRLWFLVFSAALLGLTLQAVVPGWQGLLPAGLPLASALAVFLAALACEYMDSSLGMGYGTTLTPILLLAGFEPLQIVPAVLLSELVTGLTEGLLHQRDGNVDFVRDARARRTVLLLTALSAAGALAAVLVAVSISKFWFGLAITGIILAMGVLILATLRHRIPYRAGSIVAVGTVAAFNKGLSGGGYGPLVTAGQVVSGLPAKDAVAITSLAESFTCLVGLAGYLALGRTVDLALAVPLTLGAMLSVPLATVTVRRVPEARIRAAVGVATLALGGVALLRLLG